MASASAFLLALLSLLAISVPGLTPLDEASFYAFPGERASVFEIASNNSLYHLVVVNASPAALLQKSGEDYLAVTDGQLLESVLACCAEVVENATGKSVQDTVRLILEESARSARAFKSKLYFSHGQRLAGLKRQWALASEDFYDLRRLTLPQMDVLLDAMQPALDSLGSAKTREAQEGYSKRLNELYFRADSLMKAYRTAFPLYHNSSVSLENAKQRLSEAARKRFLAPEENQAAERELTSLESSLLSAETLLVDGKESSDRSHEVLRQIAANATRVAAAVSLKQLPPAKQDDSLAIYAVTALAVLASAGAGAFFYRKKLLDAAAEKSKSAGEEISSGIEKVLAKVREMEQGKRE